MKKLILFLLILLLTFFVMFASLSPADSDRKIIPSKEVINGVSNAQKDSN
jgi:hypothetical protein